MNETNRTTDLEGSYLLGEADGELWTNRANPNETQMLCMLEAEEVGQRDLFGQPTAGWLHERAEQYEGQDQRFDALSYFEGFLSAVRRSRQMRAFAFAGMGRRRW